MYKFTQILLRWYDTHARDLPWRNTKDPYRIWISEIILQQTRVIQGLDYYLRFIERFPNVHALGDADEDEVLRYWQGLGYYSRARNLHQAAQSIQGEFPKSYSEVLSLKGIGNYTAAAICSIAFDMPYAVVDGNVYRVLSRYFGIDTPIDSSIGKKLFADMAQEYLDLKQPGKYNQAIMDFGAIQCTPVSPHCEECPLCNDCKAYLLNEVTQLPIKQHRTAVTHRYFNYLYVRARNTFWLHKRTDTDIWKGLYEMPLIETERPTDLSKLLILDEWKSLIPVSAPVNIQMVSTKKHILTHRIIHAVFFEIELSNDVPIPEGYTAIAISEWQNYAMPQLIYRFLEKRIEK